MSTMQVIPEVAPVSARGTWQPPSGKVKILYKGKRRKLYAKGMRFLTLWERIFSGMLCWHDWGFPVTLKDHSYDIKVPEAGNKPGYTYDAHQTCLRCGDHRLFATKVWTPGPAFRRVVPQPGTQVQTVA